MQARRAHIACVGCTGQTVLVVMFDVTQKPMLARLVRELPEGDVLYEPKWDGFRCLAYRDGAAVDLRSRHGRPLARYFPEIPPRWKLAPRRRASRSTASCSSSSTGASTSRAHGAPAPGRPPRWRPDREPASCRMEQLDEPLVQPGEDALGVTAAR